MGTNGIRRFPRLPEGKTLETAPIVFTTRHLSKTEKFERRLALGEVPRGYDRLKKRQRKVAKLIASGWNIHDACDKVGMTRETFYRLRRAHPMFREYLNRQIAANFTDIHASHARQVIRASQVVDETLDMEDPYAAADMAKAVLKGRGEWKTSSTSKVEHGGKLGIESSLPAEDHRLTKDIVETLVQGFISLASGAPAENEMKVITVEENGSRKALPPVPESEGKAAP